MVAENTGVEGVFGANGEDPLIFIREKEKRGKKRNLKKHCPSPQRTKSHHINSNACSIKE